MTLPCWMLALPLLGLGSSSPLLASPKPQWASVGEPMQEQVAKVAEWVDEAKQASGQAGADAQKVAEDAAKASGSMANVLAKVGSAKAAMNQAIRDEGKITALRDRVWQKAKAAAMGEIPKILPKLREQSKKKAEKKAKEKALLFGKQMKRKAKVESAKASEVYTDLMAGAGNSAADYAKLGDTLISQSAAMQMNAGMAQNQAGQYISIGDMGEAQKLLQQSRSQMNAALGLNSQAVGMYDQSNKITAQLPTYAGQAAMAAYHAQVMYDPEAQPPPPPLVLTQQRKRPRLEQSLLSRKGR